MPPRLAGRKGVSIVEVMVAVVILTVGVVGFMNSFTFVSKALKSSRTKTISANLAQEKMEVLKDIPYYQLVVTQNVAQDANYTPPVVYDTATYPPETITLWGLPVMTRSVFVAYATLTGGVLSTAPYTSVDTGLKLIVIDVRWMNGTVPVKIENRNLLANPNAQPLNSGFQGVVTEAPSNALLAGAKISVVGNPFWNGVAGADGRYSFPVSSGTYVLICSSAGHFTALSQELAANSLGYTSHDFQLTKIALGTVASPMVYLDSSVVVSQVVAATNTVCDDGLSHDAEYVELFNTTGRAINVQNNIRLNYRGQTVVDDQVNIPLTYVSTFVPPLSYYLIANAKRFYVNGINVTADAYYGGAGDTALYGDTIKSAKAGAIQITDAAGNVLDGVGWSRLLAPAAIAPWSEGTAIPSQGVQAGEQFVRMSSPCVLNASVGRAYDSDDNVNNFFYKTGLPTLPYSPFNTAVAKSVINGRPITGGFASANDGNSTATGITASTALSGPPDNLSCPYTAFSLSGVSTGTWTVQVSSGKYNQTITGVVVTQNTTTNVLNAATSPNWSLASNNNFVPLSSVTTRGYVSGVVTDNSGAALGGILVSVNGSNVTTGGGGGYFASAATGTAIVTANPGQANSSYLASTALVPVQTGQLARQDFIMSKGGVIMGFVTSGSGALPNKVIHATLDARDYAATSDPTGYFYIVASTASAAYNLSPALDTLETAVATPVDPMTASLQNPGQTIFAGTFTVTGSLGSVTGHVYAQGQIITTGVLIVASTSAVNSPYPNTIVASNAASMGSPVYAVSSQADGTYRLSVRGSASAYNIRAYYPVINIQTGAVAFSDRYKQGVVVSAGGTVGGQDFSW